MLEICPFIVAAAGDGLAGNPGPKARTGGESISFASVLTGLLCYGAVPNGNVQAALVAASLVDRTPTVPENPDAVGVATARPVFVPVQPLPASDAPQPTVVAAAPPVFVPVQLGADPENLVKADGEGAPHGIASGGLEQPVPPWFGGWELPAPVLSPVPPDLCAPGGPEALGQPAGGVAVTEAATASCARIKAPVVLRAVYTWEGTTVPPEGTSAGTAAASAGMPGHNMSMPDPVGETGGNQESPAPSGAAFPGLPPEVEGDQSVPLLLKAAVQSRNGQAQVTVPVQTAAADHEGAGRTDVPLANPGPGLLEAGQQTGSGNRAVVYAAPPLPETMRQSDGGNPVPKMLNQEYPAANGSGVAQGFFTPAAPGRAGETPAAEVFSGSKRMHPSVQGAERVFEPPAAEASQAVWLSGQTRRVSLEDLPRQLAPEIVRRITAFSGHQGVVRVELRLDPPELGSVGVRLLVTGDELKAHFFTADAAVREILLATLPELKVDLGRAGFHLGEASVSVGQEQNEESQPPPRWGGSYRASGGGGHAAEATLLAEGVNFLV